MKANEPPDEIDWSLTTWEGAQREQLRRWAALPLENIILVLEEMEALNDRFREVREGRTHRRLFRRNFAGASDAKGTLSPRP